MQSKARMTFRFEPPKPSQSAKPARQPSSPEPMPSADNEEAVLEQGFTSWNSPYQDDIHALEEIIRKSQLANWTDPSVPLQANSRKIEEYIHAPYPILKDVSETTGPEYDEGHSPGAGWLNRTTRTSEGPSWGRVFLSVTAAVATGALFGYMVLSLFTGEPLFPGKSSAGTGQSVQASSENSAIPSTDTTTTIPKDSVSNVPTAPSETIDRVGGKGSLSQVPADVYYVLQYGVFQTEDSMQTAVNLLQDKGLAFATEASEGYRVYVGAAITRDEAESLAAQMSDIEVYVKPLEGKPVAVSSATLPDGLAQFMNASAKLTRMLTQSTGIGLQDKQPQKIGAKDQTALQDAHRQWLNTISVVDKLDGKTVEDGNTIVQALNSAVLYMTEYNRKPSRFYLWTTQSAVMKALLADRHLRIVLQPSIDG